LESSKSYIEDKIDRAKKARKKIDAFTPQQGILHELKIALLAECLRDLNLYVHAVLWMLTAGRCRCQKHYVSGYKALCSLSALEQPEEIHRVAEFLNIKVRITPPPSLLLLFRIYFGHST
jgi:hypothetical protein